MLTLFSSLPNSSGAMKVRPASMILWLGLLAAPLAVPAPVVGQCRLCSEPTTVRVDPDAAATPLRVEVRTTLDFDRLILTGAGAGSALLAPDGTRQSSGSVGMVSGRAVAAEIVIRGEPGRAVRVDLPGHIDLYGLKGGSVRIGSIASNLPLAPMLDSAGELHIRIGGELTVDGDIDGDFRGDVPVFVDYL